MSRFTPFGTVTDDTNDLAGAAMRAAFLKKYINSYNLMFLGVVLAGAAMRAVYLREQINLKRKMSSRVI